MGSPSYVVAVVRALSNQMDKLSINSVWLKEQLSSVNKALDSILSIRPSQTVW
jgi:hypothetical protein